MPPAAPGTFTGKPATGYTLCEQLCRLWASRSSLVLPGQDPGLTFAEPDSSDPANLYAGTLPQRNHRLEVAAVLAPENVQRIAPSDPVYQFTVSVECHARNPREAVDLGADLVRHTLWREGKRGMWNEPVTRDGHDIRGAVGFPAVEPGEHVAVWRILSLEQASGPRWVPQASPNQRSFDGQALAVVTILITAVALEWIEPE